MAEKINWKSRNKKSKGSKAPKWAIAMENRIMNRIDNVELSINSRIDNLVTKNNLKE